MSAVVPAPGVDKARPHDRSIGRAWTSVLLIPVFAALSFAAGVVTLSAFGYSSGGDEPLWASVVVGVVASAVLLVPCVAAVYFGQRAREAGVRSAVVPMIIGAVVGAAALIPTIVTEIGETLR